MSVGRVLGALAVVTMAAAGCDSPEAQRARGGGLGGDVGNRPAEVEMHAGSDQFWETPHLIPTAPPPLDPARDAQRGRR